MRLSVNKEGLEHALELVRESQFRFNTMWDVSRPTTELQDTFISSNGWEAYGKWHLAVDADAPEGSKQRYLFPYGDFKTVHQTGVNTIKRFAEREGEAELAAAADEILDLLDRFNAC